MLPNHSFLKVSQCFCVVIILFLSEDANAQVTFQPTEGGMKGEGTSYNVYGTGALSNRIPYHRIKGSAFWIDDYKLAALYTGERRIANIPIMINLVTKEIYFNKNGKEVVLENNSIDRIVLFNSNSLTDTLTVFYRKVPLLVDFDWQEDDFFERKNVGSYELLKCVRRKLGSADSLARTQKRYFFFDESYYFVRTGEIIKRVKKLNADNLFALLPRRSEFIGWIKANEIDLRKETDVIRFLNYYNLRQ